MLVTLFLGLSSAHLVETDDAFKVVTSHLKVKDHGVAVEASWDRLARLEDAVALVATSPSSSSSSSSDSSSSSSSSSDAPASSSSSDSAEDYFELELLERKGSCINPEDEKKFTDLLPSMQDCGKQIKAKGIHGLRALRFFRECMHTTGGLSPRCAFCPGTLVACRALHCKVCGPHRNELNKERCFECDARCLEKMTKCGGIDEAPMATCQKMLTGELAWVCDVIHGKKTVQQIWKMLFPTTPAPTSAPALGLFDLEDFLL